MTKKILLPMVFGKQDQNFGAPAQWHNDFFKIKHDDKRIRIFSFYNQKAQILLDEQGKYSLNQKQIDSLLEIDALREFSAKVLFGKSAYAKLSLQKITRRLRLYTLDTNDLGWQKSQEDQILHISQEAYWLTPTSLKFAPINEVCRDIFDNKLISYACEKIPEIDVDNTTVLPVFCPQFALSTSAHDAFSITREIWKNLDAIYNVDQDNPQMSILTPLCINSILP